MSYAINKKSNEYADTIPIRLFERMSKDVFAAVEVEPNGGTLINEVWIA